MNTIMEVAVVGAAVLVSLICLPIGCWLGFQLVVRYLRPPNESVAQARHDAIVVSQRIGLAFWHASQALREAARDARWREQDGR